LRWYRNRADALRVGPSTDHVAALATIRDRRAELLRLANGEAASYTVSYYALERLRREYEMLLERLVPWDRSGRPASEHQT
jgi:hypothetical protein